MSCLHAYPHRMTVTPTSAFVPGEDPQELRSVLCTNCGALLFVPAGTVLVDELPTMFEPAELRRLEEVTR